MKRAIWGGICGLGFAIVCFGVFYYGLSFVPNPQFPEDWYVFIIPLLIPVIVGAYGAYENNTWYFRDVFVYVGKVLLSAIACSIANYIADICIGLFYTLATGTFVDYFLIVLVLGLVADLVHISY